MKDGWLVDETINGYMWLLHKRDQELCAADPGRKHCHFFSCFFITRVSVNIDSIGVFI
jgi:Ulp1 family protease